MENVTPIGSGGRIYADSRPKTGKKPPVDDREAQTRQAESKLFERIVDRLEREEKELKTSPQPRPVVEEPPQDTVDWPAITSTVLEVSGAGLLAVSGWMITHWLGVMILGLSCILMGVATGMPKRGA